MTEPLPEFHLGIIGGCMSHQRDTPVNALYHRVLGDLLRDAPGIRLRSRVARGFGADLRTRLDSLLDGPRPDGVLVHLRAAAMVWPARPVRRVWRDGALRSELNLELPGGWRHAGPSGSGGVGADEAEAAGVAYPDGLDLQDSPPGGRRIGRFRLRNLNLVVGTGLGMDRRAIGRVIDEFDEFERACRQRAMPFYVLGPTPTTYSLWADRIVRNGNAAIRKRLSGTDARFVLVEQRRDSAGHPLLRADGTHLSISGQRCVGELLYRGGMPEWMTAILAARTMAPPIHSWSHAAGEEN